VLRVGLIGAGRVAERHAEAYAAQPGATVVALAEPDRAHGEVFASRLGAAWHPSAEALLAADVVDAVSVCAPHDVHREIAVTAAEHGVHVLLEKPIATTLEDADAILSAADRAGTTLMVGFVHRFRTEAAEAKRLVAAGAIGEPATALDRFCSLGGPHPPPWVWSRDHAGGGVLMYGGIHGVDRLLWLLEDEVDSVAARTHAYGGYGDVEDGLVAMLGFRRGATAALFENSPPYGRPGGWATELFGAEGAIRIQTGVWVELTTRSGTVTVAAEDEGHFEREIAEFVSAIAEARAPSVTGRDGRDALAVALAVYEAARRNPGAGREEE
jgi:predicted dehydrogenase